MRIRLLFALALVLATLVGVLLLQFAGASPEVLASGPGRAPAAKPTAPSNTEVADVDTPTPAQARAPLARAAAEPMAVETGGRSEAGQAVAAVIVRVRLSMADGSSFNFAGHTVETQSWLTDTDEIFPHTAEADAEGIAEFRFEESVHLDFVRFVPPPEYGLAFAFVEDHIDLDPGDVYEPELELHPGGQLGARVVDDFGLAVQGARVHAYYEDSWSDLSDWDPGVIHAETGPDGRFTLPLLPEGSWGLAVEPAGWLQVDPSLHDVEEGRSWFELEAGDRLEGGDLVVTSLHRFAVNVVDGAGRPAPRAYVNLVPRKLRSPTLVLDPRQELDEVEAFLSETPAPDDSPGAVAWPYEDLSWVTDADGSVEVLGVSGSWDLRVRPQLGAAGGSEADVVVPLELPTPDQTVHLGSPLWKLEGRLVNRDDEQPIGRANVVLTRTSEGSSSNSTRTDANGRFVLEGLPPDGRFRLTSSHNAFVHAQWDITPGSLAEGEEPPEFRVTPAARVSFRLVDRTGEPLKGKRVQLKSGHPSPPLGPAETELFDSYMRSTYLRVTNRRGSASFQPLPRGRYVVALLLPMATGNFAPNGQPVTRQEVFQTWELDAQQGVQELVCDLSGYIPPAPMALTVHRGVVLDAASGEPVSHARVRLTGQNTSNWVVSDMDGSFEVRSVAGVHGLRAMREGYLPRTVPDREYTAGETYHELALQPGGHPLVVRLHDRDGVRMPTVDVRFADAAGAERYCLVQRSESNTSWRTHFTAAEGVLAFASVEPGPLTLEVSIGGIPLGAATVEVFGGRAPQELDVEFEKSLEELRAKISAAFSEDDD